MVRLCNPIFISHSNMYEYYQLRNTYFSICDDRIITKYYLHLQQIGSEVFSVLPLKVTACDATLIPSLHSLLLSGWRYRCFLIVVPYTLLKSLLVKTFLKFKWCNPT